MLRKLAAIAATGMLLPALAGEGRIPIYRQTDIDQPGSYVVTRDIDVAKGRAIGIYADDVTLDLNGHTISSTDSAWAVVDIQMSPTETGGIRILNGRLVGGRYGISGSQAKRLFVERVEIVAPTLHGIELQQAGYFEVDACTMVDPGTRGLNASGPDGISGRVTDNTISGSVEIGILLTNFAEGEVTGNQLDLTAALSSAIQVQTQSGTGFGANLISRNRIRHAGLTGIAFTTDSPGNLVVDNVIRFVGATESVGSGIVAGSTGNFIARNIVADHRHGIDVEFGGGNHLESNKAYGNEYGIYFSVGTDNTYRDNLLVGNTLGPIGGDGAATAIDGGGNIP